MKQDFKNGFTLVESLIGMVLLGILITSAMTIMSNLTLWEKRVSLSFDYSALRNQIVTQLTDYRAWPNTVKAGSNSIYNCFVSQDQTAPASRDCAGQTGTIDFYDLANVQVYNFQSSSFGFTLKGQTCSTFSSVAGSGDFNCPLRLNLQSVPLCPGVGIPCPNPLVKLTGQFVFNGADNYANLRLSNLDFVVYNSNLYCPAQSSPISMNVVSNVSIAGPVITSTEAGKVASSGIAQSDVNILPCRQVNITFNDNMQTAFIPGLDINDAENRTITCLYDTDSGQCIFESRIYGAAGAYTYELFYKGVSVATKPAWLNITSTTTFEYRVSNGLVKFCVDDQCLHFFEGKLDFPFLFRVTPAGADYSPGGVTVQNISTED